MNRPAISVVLPCYNATATLPGALESLLSQTRSDLEILAVDDGSTDETPLMLERYARKRPCEYPDGRCSK